MKKMKKIVYILMVLGVVFTSCEPMDDIYDDIDAQQTQEITGEAEYTLTDEDYEDLELTYGSFNSEDEAKTLIPALLTEMYPHWGKNSSVLVGYKLYVGAAEGVSDYTGATSYTFTNEDYPGYTNNAFALFPDEKAVDILATTFPDAVEGDIVLAKYKEYVEEPVLGIINYFESDFQTAQTLLNFEAISVVGDQTWVETEKYGAKMSGYSGGAQLNEDWLISSAIDLTTQSNLTFQVNQAINYSTQLDLLNILVSKDYTGNGDPSSATWDTIEITEKPDGTNWTFVTSEEVDFTAYEGETIYIAFKYESTTATAATWEIANAVIKTPGAEGETISKEIFYTFTDGEWVEAEGVYYLTGDDFDSMGEGSGQPGQYNNFSSSISPDNYLPTFLKTKYPYAQEEDELFVIYPYYSSTSGAQVRGNLYTFTDGVWVGHQSTIETTLQFGHDGSTWVPDNTIKYTLVSDDYAYLSAELEGNPLFDNVNLGSLAKYNDYDYNWSDDQILYSLNVLLNHLNPNAEEGQKYLITYLLYDNGTNDVSRHLIKKEGEWIWNE